MYLSDIHFYLELWIMTDQGFHQFENVRNS